MYKQAKWNEPLICDLSQSGKSAVQFGEPDVPIYRHQNNKLLRRSPLNLPNVSEIELVRHVVRLSQMTLGIDSATYPLGSCTMKLNPKINERIAQLDNFKFVHPDQPEESCQGSLEVIYRLQQALKKISGLPHISCQPPAGASGEFVGVSIIKKYLETNNLQHKTEMIVPDSAHGTNPASAAIAGFKIRVVPTNDKGQIDFEQLVLLVNEKTAGIMITNPNTLGLFEERIVEIAEEIHRVGGLLYYDGANLNAICTKFRPGDMGFDVVHFNLHKTFSTPHGGGGPGSGPVGVTEELSRFLPYPRVQFKPESKIAYSWTPKDELSIGKVHGYGGNFGMLLRALAYIYALGENGLRNATEQAVLNANYMFLQFQKIPDIDVPFGNKQPRMHEFVVSTTSLLKEYGISALNVAKALISEGIHAPTVYFPLIVKEALMIEPTESESKRTIDAVVNTMRESIKRLKDDPALIQLLPYNTSIGPLNEIEGARRPVLTWKML